jgi:hypothetical protein
MRLSWNEIRARAARFADEWKTAHYEKGESQTFYNEFFEVFGVTRRRVASFEEPVKKLGDERGFIDLFWKGVLLVEQKSAGRDLIRAKQQALDYFPGLKENELPRYILVSDFPPQLRKAHRALDDAVDKLYRSAAFTGDRDRAEHLFGIYERLVAPLVAAAFQPTRRRKKTDLK